MSGDQPRATGCDSRDAIIARRWDAAPAFFPALPLFGTPLQVPVNNPTLATFGTIDGGPREFWITFNTTSRNVRDAGVITERTLGGEEYPNSTISRAEILLDGRTGQLRFETDMRGVIVTPPTASGTINLLSYAGARRIDKGVSELPASAGNPLVAIDTINVYWRSVQQHNTVGRLTRNEVRVSLAETFIVSTVLNQTPFLILRPWCRRVRWRSRQISGGPAGGVEMALLNYAGAAVDKLQSILIPEGSDWVDVSGAIGLQPIVTGTGTQTFNVRVEEECFV